MPQLTLDPEQTSALAHALESYLGELRAEIAGTDSYDMREQLKRQESILDDLVAQLGGGTPESPPPL
jgi:hypothetical protein